jgi:hypothetical protein
MQTTSAPPESPDGTRPTSASPRRRPWRTTAIVAGIVVIAGAIAWGTTFVATYEPVSAAFTSFSPAPFGHDLGHHNSPEGSSFEEWGVECHAGQPVHIGFTITNSGPVGVTVTSLFPPQYSDYVIRFVDPRMGPGSGSLGHVTNGPLTPFRPFSLAPGQLRHVQMSVVQRTCGPGITIIGRSEMSFRVLGITRHQTLLFPYTLLISRTGLRSA